MVTTDRQFQEIKITCLGESWHRNATKLGYDVVYINIENSDFLWQLVDTVVHELVHLKYPKLRHGSHFQNVVNDIIELYLL